MAMTSCFRRARELPVHLANALFGIGFGFRDNLKESAGRRSPLYAGRHIICLFHIRGPSPHEPNPIIQFLDSRLEVDSGREETRLCVPLPEYDPYKRLSRADAIRYWRQVAGGHPVPQNALECAARPSVSINWSLAGSSPPQNYEVTRRKLGIMNNYEFIKAHTGAPICRPMPDSEARAAVGGGVRPWPGLWGARGGVCTGGGGGTRGGGGGRELNASLRELRRLIF